MTKLLVFLVLAGCGVQVSETALNPPGRAMTAKPAAQVEVFTSGAPARAHTDVMLLEARPIIPEPLEDTIATLREEAAQRGCDGIVINGLRAGSSTLDGSCIVYRQ
jgi:hypothetical protein